MNIFVLDENPKLAARWHVFRHVVKMPAESVQMMNCAVTIAGVSSKHPGGLNISKSIAYKNHPCTVWTRESLSNFLWLRQLAWELTLEGYYRHGNIWSYVNTLHRFPWPDIPDLGLTPFAQAVPEECKREDAVLAYRLYYKTSKRSLHLWNNRPCPPWITREDSGITAYSRRATSWKFLRETQTCDPDDIEGWPRAWKVHIRKVK